MRLTMKKTLAFAALVSSSFALSSIAQGEMLARYKRSGGFCPGGCPTTVIIVHTDGRVMKRTTHTSPSGTSSSTSLEQLAQLEPGVLSALESEVNNLNRARLQNPGGPICADIPTVAYHVKKTTNNRRFVIGRDQNCQEWRPRFNTGYNVIEILKGLARLGDL